MQRKVDFFQALLHGLYFKDGKARGADLSQADGNMKFSATKESGLYLIRAGNERYEVVEAVVFGG